MARLTRTLAMMNQKGGVGKTTTTVNLGAALAALGHHVLMIDLDPQAHLTIHVGLDPTELPATVYDLLSQPETSAEQATTTVADRLHVIGAEVDLAAAEQELATQADRFNILRQKLTAVRSQYDFILIDCPPSLGLLTLNGLAVADEVVVPMQAHFLALQGLSKLLETIQLVRQQIQPALRVGGVVLCMHDAQTRLAGEVVADLKAFFEASRKMAMPWSEAVVFDPPIRRNIKLAESPSFGQTIFQYEPSCQGAKDYRSLAIALSGSSKTDTETDASSSSSTAASVAPCTDDVSISERVANDSADGHSAEKTSEENISEEGVSSVPGSISEGAEYIPGVEIPRAGVAGDVSSEARGEAH